MLINFQLRPLEQIAPWGTAAQPTLHWFGLTDGWYWLEVGDQALFRYIDEALRLWPTPDAQAADLPYVDYYVVRFWEDLQEMLPAILEPIPQTILAQIPLGSQGIRWWRQMQERLAQETAAHASDLYSLLDQAIGWQRRRWLDVGYLPYGPRIWFWNDRRQILIHWDNRAVRRDSVQVWTASEGTLALPVTTFIDEVRAFDQRLIQAMHERVVSVQHHWPRPEIQIDIVGLLKEQAERSQWLERSLALADTHSATDWHAVAMSVKQVEDALCQHPSNPA